MKKIFSALLILLSLNTKSQITESVTVKAGEDLETVLSSHGMYSFPAFTRGTVALRDGSLAGALMNFNIFLGQIQFIDPKGDTLVIADPETVDSISIDTSLFYYKKGYLQVISNSPTAKLVRKQTITFRPIKLGAYGNQSPGASIENYGSVNTLPYVNNNHLTLNEDIIVIKETTYSVFYKKYREAPAIRQGFLSAFAANKNAVENYISTNNIDFKNENSLKMLFHFCIQQR